MSGTFLAANLKFFSISLPSMNKAELIFRFDNLFLSKDVFGLLILKSLRIFNLPSLNFTESAFLKLKL